MHVVKFIPLVVDRQALKDDAYAERCGAGDAKNNESPEQGAYAAPEENVEVEESHGQLQKEHQRNVDYLFDVKESLKGNQGGSVQTPDVGSYPVVCDA